MFRVNHVDELPDDLHGTVGVTAGASAPEELVDAVIARLAPREGVEEVTVTDEDEYFPPPRNIRELQAAVEMAATVMVGGSVDERARRWTTAPWPPATSCPRCALTRLGLRATAAPWTAAPTVACSAAHLSAWLGASGVQRRLRLTPRR